MGPHLGCFGDAFAVTPNLDRLAARGVRYRCAWAIAPVCTPARTAIIAGMYPQSLGAEHVRGEVAPPPFLRRYPQMLREAGYYCIQQQQGGLQPLQARRRVNDSSPRAH